MNNGTKNRARHPKLIAFSAPSGAGKSTICKILLQRDPKFALSISATTRPPRGTEKNGVHYYFLSRRDFEQKIAEGDFLEYEEVHGNFYGTMKSALRDLLDSGKSVLFDIDVKGALNVKKHFPEAILIFVKPPSLTELRRRLLHRKSDSEAEIEKRLSRLELEYRTADQFDYVVVNDILQQTVDEILRIIYHHEEIQNC